MKTSGPNVLLIEDNDGDAELIRDMLYSSGRKYSLKRAERLSEVLKLLEKETFDAELLRDMLYSSEPKCSLKRAERLSEGLKLLEKETFDVVLLDLGLPDNIGVDAL